MRALSSRPPRLLVRTLTVTFMTVAIVLVTVLVAVTLSVREQVRESVAANLESSQRIFAALESRRQRELRAQVETLAESPMLKAAVDTWQAESAQIDERGRDELVATIRNELSKLASRLESDAIVLVDAHRRVLASAGRGAGHWDPGRDVDVSADPTMPSDGIIHEGTSVCRAVAVPLMLDEQPIGELLLLTALDAHYAEELASVARARTAILSDNLMVATTLDAEAARQFERAVAVTRPAEGTAALGTESYAFRRLVQVGDTTFYVLASIDESSKGAFRAAITRLGWVSAGALLLALLASVWLAHMVSGPIGRLSGSISALAAARDVHGRLPLTGSSLELDTLTDTFNALMASVAAAEAQTQAAYTGAIRALAAALDARDPYTAGHSERVSVLSVAIGRALHLSAGDLEVIRLGALLHDIGKIGVPDDVLRKPGKLTAAEFDLIKQHPTLGARILRSVPFLAPHLVIVELHHERPDGLGYPLGLRADDIPLAARIVHAADAYDAMTTARSYRPARPGREAIEELWRCAGTQFHAEIIAALATALPGLTSEAPSFDDAPLAVR